MDKQQELQKLSLGMQQNQTQMFELLYKKYFNMIKYFVLKNSGTDDDASDLFQESMVVVYEKLRDPGFNLSCAIQTYIYSIARNLWLKKLRSRQITGNIKDYEDYIELEVAEDDPTERQQHILKKCLDKLGELCKDILVGFYYQNMKMEEIAVKYNYTSADHAKSQKYKCMQRLKRMTKDFID